jgi:very-short-patch-repair endonuclease
MGWLVLRFWDIEINKQLEMCVNTVLEGIIEAKIAK